VALAPMPAHGPGRDARQVVETARLLGLCRRLVAVTVATSLLLTAVALAGLLPAVRAAGAAVEAAGGAAALPAPPPGAR
jgi:hypothetical protein